MQMVTFTGPNAASAKLRPTHAVKVAQMLNGGLSCAGDSLIANAGTLAEAVRQVRDTYLCRTVRKELRRVGLVCVDGVTASSSITITSDDTATLDDMTNPPDKE